MRDFYKLHFNAGDLLDPSAGAASITIPEPVGAPIKPRSEREPSIFPAADTEATLSLRSASSEYAARYYAHALLDAHDSEPLRAIADNGGSDLVPNLRLVGTESMSLNHSNLVTFEQTVREIPVFGSKAVVEIDSDDNRLLSFDGHLAAPTDVSPLAGLSPDQALSRLAEACGGEILEPDRLAAAPALVYFQDERDDRWHLAYHFKSLALNPPDDDGEPLPQEFASMQVIGCGFDHSLQEPPARYDYLVDANDGDVVFWFKSAAHFNVPVPCLGLDDHGVQRQFLGLSLDDMFVLHDPLRNISTYDLNLGVANPNTLPAQAVSHSNADFATHHPAAVSAHCNATTVFDFFNDVLKRKSIDNLGMHLRSVVNVVESAGAQDWKNAMWWHNIMWYGRVQNSSGMYESLARHLDIIAHELTHGVTESTAGLVYAHLSGALNESFSDIFGVLIHNWDPQTGFKPLQGWNWEIGAGLGSAGSPIRNFRNPAATGQPTHFSQYHRLSNDRNGDWGGVHYYSGIHNLAAYRLLQHSDGSAGLPPQEVSLLYYLALTRLGARSDFLDCRLALLNVAGAYYANNVGPRSARLQAIADAYDSVGIL